MTQKDLPINLPQSHIRAFLKQSAFFLLFLELLHRSETVDTIAIYEEASIDHAEKHNPNSRLQYSLTYRKRRANSMVYQRLFTALMCS